MTIAEFHKKYADLEYIQIGPAELAECPDLAGHLGEFLLIGDQFADIKDAEEMVQEITDHVSNLDKYGLCDLYNLIFDRKFTFMSDEGNTEYKEVK